MNSYSLFLAPRCFMWVTQAISPVSSSCEVEAFTAEGAEHAGSGNQDSLAILVSRYLMLRHLVSRHLCGLSKHSERARGK